MKVNTLTAAFCTAVLLATTGASVYAQRADFERRIAKIDIDGDFNYDGVIDNYDPTDNGTIQVTPPGLYLGVGEMSKLLLRVKPYRVDDKGEAVISLELAGVNRADESGLFSSFDEEVANTGHVRVWKDAARTELLLDSTNPELRRREWTVETGRVPSYVYIEGVSPSSTEGDVKLLMTIESRRKAFESFEPSFDHNLFTVVPQCRSKATSSDVWLGSCGAVFKK
jgi:hypothetical protein